ncbi:hypothetical protein B9J77_00475 [candidate division NPL-UPA2 bacterium Unc8]|uniref:Uncharacterized protein n=1 Tax=candidate division NPL-UPA2 bacterium Unc8 TaxID=1980939 RepID=A0A399G002_UNCN2|nr:putative tRNA sulfurtransferase [Bacillota bacterium]MBT9146745.1 putative tRNA sulfurtransferase [Bacillota bacterium]RII01046.1 MAG: hypothetical protein B9J77_00475 [candidate division NPL-UPA2 bacterium Unc8]
MRKRKAIALLSGGLDSTLAVRIVQDQGIELEAVNFLTPFCTCTSRNSCQLACRQAAETMNIPLKVINVFSEYLDIVRHPEHGYGKNMNPCIDCRIFMFRRAKDYMEERGASFLVTGEVLGERPMSQRRESMETIDRDTGLGGLILRPLSAQLLPPTIPEKNGWIERDRLLSISGRSRKPQMKLAEKFGINDYPCPAGGCLLTDGNFASRLRDIFRHSTDISLNDINLLKSGRHFRLSNRGKIVVGRNEEENEQIFSLASEGDLCFKMIDSLGPLTIARGVLDDADTLIAASITARYGKEKEKERVKIACLRVKESRDRESIIKSQKVLSVTPLTDEEIEPLRI